MNIAKLEEIASAIRGCIISNSHKTHTPHLASCLSCVDILVAAYFHSLRIDPQKPNDPTHRFIPVRGSARLFQVLAKRGF